MKDRKNILQIKDLNVWFHNNGTSTNAVNNLSFDIYNNEIVALVGKTGSGKTLTALSILNLVKQPKATISGSIQFYDTDILTLSEKQLCDIRGSEIAYIGQDPISSLNPVYKIKKQFTEYFVVKQKITYKKAYKQSIEILQHVGLHDTNKIMESYPFELSSGMLQRVLIAMAVSMKPKLLIADEPTSNLDSTNKSKIIDLLVTLKMEKAINSILLISHDTTLIENIADRIVLIGNNKENKHDSEILAQKKEDSGKHRREKLLEISNLNISVKVKAKFWQKKETYPIVQNISFTLYKRESLGIVGQSGSGKTTIARALTGLLKHYMSDAIIDGTINLYDNLHSVDLSSQDRKHRSKLDTHIQMIFQNPKSSLNPSYTVRKLLADVIVLHNSNMPLILIEDSIFKMLEMVELNNTILDRYPICLSGGEAQRVAIAIALCCNPKIIICDEIFSSMDFATKKTISDLFLKLNIELDISYIIISHDEYIIDKLCSKILVL